jgi:O-antigen biosynthesis protein WbqP
MKRLFDIFFAIFISILLLVFILFLSLMIFISSKGPILYWSSRVGYNGKLFNMPKFRSMKKNAPELASHLIQNPKEHLTIVGKYLRRYSLDEIPQLYSIINGDMSFVGPRPALFNQYDLINLRKNKGIDKLVPGVTGWAQINGRDNISISKKVELDYEYLINQSLLFDLKILWKTLLRVIQKEGVSH